MRLCICGAQEVGADLAAQWHRVTSTGASMQKFRQVLGAAAILAPVRQRTTFAGFHSRTVHDQGARRRARVTATPAAELRRKPKVGQEQAEEMS